MIDKSLLRYHPYRYAHHMDFILRKVVQEYQATPNEIKEKARGLLTGCIFNEYLQSVVQSHPELFDKVSITNAKEWIEHKESLLGFYEDFLRADEKIFQFEASWINRVNKDLISNVTIAQLKFPSSSFYLYFHPESMFNIWMQDYGFEGAYISYSEEKNGEVLLFIAPTTFKRAYDYSLTIDPVKFLMEDVHFDYIVDDFENNRIIDAFKNFIRTDDPQFPYASEQLSKWLPFLDEINTLIIAALLHISSMSPEYDENICIVE
jgi:hypothetical protein